VVSDTQPEPIGWGTSSGLFGADSPDTTEAEGQPAGHEARVRRGRFGVPGGPAKRDGKKGKPRGGSSRGKNRFDAADSPFGPVVGSSADEAADTDSVSGRAQAGGAEFDDPASSGSRRGRAAGKRRDGGTSRSRGSRTTPSRGHSFEEGLSAEHPEPADGPDGADGTGSLTPGELQKSPEEWTSAARAILLRQLTMAPRSRHQLATKLAEREIPSDVAKALLDRFEEVKLIDDAEFARMWVRTRTTGKSLSRSAIRRELADRGIDGELAEDALLQVSDEDEHLQAREVVLRRVRRTTDLSDRQARDKEVRRLVGMLARKGYSPGVGFSIVRDVLDDVSSQDSAD
jgi:SOS response regulatory protein OraA/RecX